MSIPGIRAEATEFLDSGLLPVIDIFLIFPAFCYYERQSIEKAAAWPGVRQVKNQAFGGMTDERGRSAVTHTLQPFFPT